MSCTNNRVKILIFNYATMEIWTGSGCTVIKISVALYMQDEPFATTRRPFS